MAPNLVHLQLHPPKHTTMEHANSADSVHLSGLQSKRWSLSLGWDSPAASAAGEVLHKAVENLLPLLG